MKSSVQDTDEFRTVKVILEDVESGTLLGNKDLLGNQGPSKESRTLQGIRDILGTFRESF